MRKRKETEPDDGSRKIKKQAGFAFFPVDNNEITKNKHHGYGIAYDILRFCNQYIEGARDSIGRGARCMGRDQPA